MGFWDDIFDPTNVIGTTLGRGGRPTDAYKNFLKVWGLARDEINRDSRKWRSNPNATRSLNFPESARFSKPKNPFSQRQPPGVTTEDILAQLEALQDPSRYLMDSGALDMQARAAASAQFDPLIAALEQQMGAASSRGQRNKAELGQMFSSLSSDLQGDIPEIQQLYSGSKAASQKSFDELQQEIKGTYAQSAAEQEEMLKRLNIEAAAPDILPEQQRDRDYFTQLAARDAAVEQTALGQEERGAVEFTRQGSQIARSEGTQRQANLMADLQDLLNQYQGQIGAHRAAKQQAYMAGRSQLESEMMSGALDRSQRDFDNFIRSIQLGRELRKDELGGPAKSVKSPADAGARALSLGLDESGAQNIQDVFMSALGRDPLILAGVDPNTGGRLPKEALALRILEAGRASGLSRAELNALQTIALEYFGRG